MQILENKFIQEVEDLANELNDRFLPSDDDTPQSSFVDDLKSETRSKTTSDTTTNDELESVHNYTTPPMMKQGAIELNHPDPNTTILDRILHVHLTRNLKLNSIDICFFISPSKLHMTLKTSLTTMTTHGKQKK